MTSHDHFKQVCASIHREVERVRESTTFQAWWANESPKAGDLIVINNSFLYREGGITTTKSKKYLSFIVGGDNDPSVAQLKSRINMVYKRVSARQIEQYHIRELRSAVEDEIESLGTIVLSLVGRIGADVPVSVDLPHAAGFESLRYEPGQPQVAQIEGSDVCINRLDDIDAVWEAITLQVEHDSNARLDSLAEQFERSFNDLRETAGRPINVEDITLAGPSILSEVVSGLTQQVSAYRQALETHLANPDDTEALYEVLRIAYNFADGAKDLIALVVGVSDLKPILFWLSISAQSNLSERFAELPFSLVGKSKPSLERYRGLIAGARNRAFHDLFAFGRPFRVPLRSDAFEAAQLHLFREYGKRGGPALDYIDRDLVELLQGFTRAAERPVPLGFWKINLRVMEAVEEVARALQRALVLVMVPPGKDDRPTPLILAKKSTVARP
jgi:hypothetical protein